MQRAPLFRTVAAACLMATGCAALAATPDPGVWLIDSENNGLPGRGLQLEVQNGILATPTLIRVSPEPVVRLIGELSDSAKVLAALGIVPAQA